MILGDPKHLDSKFRSTYSMILKLLRVENLKIEEMVKRSFYENKGQRLLPKYQEILAEVSLSIAIIFIVIFLS